MNDMIQAARGWFELGHVPMAARSKRPLAPGWQALDPAEHLRRIEAQPPEQIGLRMGRQRDGRILLAIDVDRDEGEASLVALAAELGPLPSTLAQITGGGGRHLVFEWPRELASECPTTSSSKLGRRVDIRGERGHIVAAPSPHESGRAYELLDPEARPAPLPDAWVRRIIETHAPARPDPVPSHEASRGESGSSLERCRRYVRKMEPAISGAGGHRATWRVAQVAVRGFSLSRDQALSVLREYNGRCEPPWSERELEHKIDSAEQKSRMPARCLLDRSSDEWDPASWDDAYDREPEQEPDARVRAPALELLGAEQISQLANEYVERLADGREAPISTGWAQLDEQLDGGFWPGLHVLCGPSGAMKTQLALTIAISAARTGTPVVVVALEQRRHAWAARVKAELAEVSWSKTIRGRMNPNERERYAAAAWPEKLMLAPGEPYRFPIDRVVDIGAELRRRYPTGQALIVVDYCQLIGDIGATDETRQRVMRAALAAQRAAHSFDMAILLLSSVARERYAMLADLPSNAGMLATFDGQHGAKRELRKAHTLIGIGKESGEIEYSAESVTVVARGRHPDIPGAKVVIAATAKRRCGDESWCAFRSEHGRLFAAPDYRVEARAPGDDGESEAQSAALERKHSEVDQAIHDALSRHQGGLTQRGLRGEVSGFQTSLVCDRIAYLEEVAKTVIATDKPGRGGGRLYRLAPQDGTDAEELGE